MAAVVTPWGSRRSSLLRFHSLHRAIQIFRVLLAGLIFLIVEVWISITFRPTSWLPFFNELVLNSCQCTYCLKKRTTKLSTTVIITIITTKIISGLRRALTDRRKRRNSQTFNWGLAQQWATEKTPHLTYSCWSNRGFTEEPLSFLKLPVPSIIFAIRVSITHRRSSL